jgi:uncharacterized membrane protein (UPF0127 family)
LDVVWVFENKVVGVQEKIPAPTDEQPIPVTMTPRQEVDMVLEVPSGFVQENRIKVGDVVKVGS